MKFMQLCGLIHVLLLFAFPQTALGQWQDEIGVFRIGIVTGEEQTAELAKAEPFRLAVEGVLGMEVQFFAARKPQFLIDALVTERIEYAILSAFSYAVVWNLCECVEPIVSPRSTDSTDGYHIVLISGKDGPDAVSGLVGVTVATLLEDGSPDHAILMRSLESDGIDLDTVDFASTESGETMLAKFAQRRFSVLAGWSSLTGLAQEGYSRGNLHEIVSWGLGNPIDFQIIWKSAQLPHRAHAIRNNLPEKAVNQLRSFLTTLHDRDVAAYDGIEPTYGGGFVTTRHARFKPYIDLVRSIDPAKVLSSGQTEPARQEETQ